MARVIVQQPSGLFAIWSTVVDDFLSVDMTEEEVKEFMLEGYIEDAQEKITMAIKKAKKDESYYTYEELREFLAEKEREEDLDV